jgi:hypothetical protein
MPPGTVKVDRTTRWGNPIHHDEHGERLDNEVAVGLFTKLVAEQGGYAVERPGRPSIFNSIADIRRELAGHHLACWCPIGKACHADVLIELANGPSAGGL